MLAPIARRLTPLCVSAAMIGATASAQIVDLWTIDSGRLPTEESPPWEAFTGTQCQNATATLGATSLLLDNTSACADDYYLFKADFTGAFPLPAELWIEGRCRVVQSSDARPDEGACILHVSRPNICGWVLHIDDGEIFLTWDAVRVASLPLNTTSAMVDYLLVTDTATNEASVHVNGQPVMVDVPPGPMCITPGVYSQKAMFGQVFGAEPAITEWETVSHNANSVEGEICDWNRSPNSSGALARIATATPPYSNSISANDVTLTVDGLPVHSFGIFLTSRTGLEQPFPGPPGLPLCLNGPVGRFTAPGQIRQASAAGRVELQIDLHQLPLSNSFVPAMAGDVWAFQYWFRNVTPPPLFSDFSTAMYLHFEQ